MNILAVNFQTKKRIADTSASTINAKVAKRIEKIKKDLTAKQYVMFLEGLASPVHHDRITDKMLLRRLDNYLF